jgi:hypothetical protein
MNWSGLLILLIGLAVVIVERIQKAGKWRPQDARRHAHKPPSVPEHPSPARPPATPSLARSPVPPRPGRRRETLARAQPARPLPAAPEPIAREPARAPRDRLRGMLREPASLRDALVLAEILGPPRAHRPLRPRRGPRPA